MRAQRINRLVIASVVVALLALAFVFTGPSHTLADWLVMAAIAGAVVLAFRHHPWLSLHLRRHE